MSDYIKELNDLLTFENDVDPLEEGVGQGMVSDIAQTMADNPRVRSRMKRIGIDIENSGTFANLVSVLEPAITMFIDGSGGKVQGVSAAKRAMKDTVSHKREDEDNSSSVLQEGDAISWEPGVGFWTQAQGDMARELREHCDTLKEALVILNSKINRPIGMKPADVDRILRAKETIFNLY